MLWGPSHRAEGCCWQKRKRLGVRGLSLSHRQFCSQRRAFDSRLSLILLVAFSHQHSRQITAWGPSRESNPNPNSNLVKKSRIGSVSKGRATRRRKLDGICDSDALEANRSQLELWKRQEQSWRNCGQFGANWKIGANGGHRGRIGVKEAPTMPMASSRLVELRAHATLTSRGTNPGFLSVIRAQFARTSGCWLLHNDKLLLAKCLLSDWVREKRRGEEKRGKYARARKKGRATGFCHSLALTKACWLVGWLVRLVATSSHFSLLSFLPPSSFLPTTTTTMTMREQRGGRNTTSGTTREWSFGVWLSCSREVKAVRLAIGAQPLLNLE